MKLSRFLTVLSLILFVASVRATVVPYTTPSLGPVSTEFTLKVAGRAVPVYAFQRDVDKPDYYFAHFSFDGTVTVTVAGTGGPAFSAATVSPLAFAIPTKLRANTLSFPLSESRYLIVKIDALKELVIAADSLETNVPAAEGEGIYNVVTLGADLTGTSNSTSIFTRAIASAAKHAGGGTVYVPDGLYTVGNLILESNVTLYLSGGAVMQASRNPKDFTTKFIKNDPNGGKESKAPEPGTWFISTAPHSSNITIRGRGVIDGTGSYLTHHEYLLDDLIVPLGTSHFTLDGIVGWDAGFWALTPSQSHDVHILNYKGMQSMTTYQDDGIDINEDQNIFVKHTIVVSRDDCYSTKTWGPKGLGTNWPDAPQPVFNAVFQDVVAWTTDGAFKVGQGDYVGHSHIIFDHDYVYSAHWAFYLRPDVPMTDKAAPVDSVTFSNIDVETSTARREHFSWLGISLPFASLSNVTFHNVNVRSRGDAPKFVTGPTAKISQIHVDNVFVGGKKMNSLDDMGIDTSGVNLTGVTFAPASTAGAAPVPAVQP